MRRAPVRAMRRWGVGWRNILKCVLGFHGRRVNGHCVRCGFPKWGEQQRDQTGRI